MTPGISAQETEQVGSPFSETRQSMSEADLWDGGRRGGILYVKFEFPLRHRSGSIDWSALYV